MVGRFVHHDPPRPNSRARSSDFRTSPGLGLAEESSRSGAEPSRETPERISPKHVRALAPHRLEQHRPSFSAISCGSTVSVCRRAQDRSRSSGSVADFPVPFGPWRDPVCRPHHFGSSGVRPPRGTARGPIESSVSERARESRASRRSSPPSGLSTPRLFLRASAFPASGAASATILSCRARGLSFLVRHGLSDLCVVSRPGRSSRDPSSPVRLPRIRSTSRRLLRIRLASVSSVVPRRSGRDASGASPPALRRNTVAAERVEQLAVMTHRVRYAVPFETAHDDVSLRRRGGWSVRRARGMADRKSAIAIWAVSFG